MNATVILDFEGWFEECYLRALIYCSKISCEIHTALTATVALLKHPALSCLRNSSNGTYLNLENNNVLFPEQ
jgi:hypothetical protein